MQTLDSLSNFTGALKQIFKADDNISTEKSVLEQYSRDCSLVSVQKPLLAVFPENKDELISLVKLANEAKMPLVPVSSGPPRFNGDTLPAEGGVIVDFRKMKRIIKIDPVNRVVIAEPGVTYAELVPEARKQGLKLNIPFLPRANKSVVASRLEREPVLIPKYQYDYIDPLLTLELVYGTGDLFRTGSASGPGDLDHLKSDKVNPWGPGGVDYFRFISGAQGTMGLVTWASIKAEVQPSMQHFYFIPTGSAGQCMAAANELLRKRVLDECLALNNINLATVLADLWPEDYRELAQSLPEWTLIVSISGYQRRPEERVNIQEKMLFNICEQMNVTPQSKLRGAGGRESRIQQLLTGAWQKEPYWKLCRTGAGCSIFFLSPLSRAGELFDLARAALSRNGYQNDIGCYLQPMVQGRGCHCELDLPYNGSDPGEIITMKKIFQAVSETLFKNGAFFSRPYGPWSDLVYSHDKEGTAMLKKIKGLFDPNNILNPGKLCF
jgi:FAD/FMN-containing dehydrogenase